MIRATLPASCLTLALLLPLPAFAEAPRPALRSHVAVAADVVTVGDLVENAGAKADVALFHAPDLGGSGTIQVWRVLEALRSQALDGVDVRGVNEVRVERRGRSVSDIELQHLLAGALMSRLSVADRQRIDLRLDASFGDLLFDAAETAVVQVDRLVHDGASGRFEALVTVPESRRARPVRVTGVAVEQVDVVRLRRTLNRGELVNASDVMIERAPRNRVPADVANGPGEVVGMATRRTMIEGGLIRTADVERPRVIARNDPVTIVLDAGALVVTARGRAQDGGAVGDVIDVQNVSSRRVIQATITGPGKVAVRLGGQRRIASTEPSSSR